MSTIPNNTKPTGETTVACIPSTMLIRKIRSRPHAFITLISGPQAGSYYFINRKKEVILGSSIDANIQISDVGVSRIHISLYWKSGKTYVKDLNSSNGSLLNGMLFTNVREINNGDLITIGASTSIKFNLSNKLDTEYQQNISQQLTHDNLTNVFNKRFFVEYLNKEHHYSKRNDTALCLLMIDIDHFKNINDTFGHVAGDAVLIQLSNSLLEISRKEDYVCRFGGEEFTIMCRGLTSDKGLLFAERVRSTVESLQVKHASDHLSITVSIGVTSYPEVNIDSLVQLIEHADQAMYLAKKTGRNRVVLYDAEIPRSANRFLNSR